MRFIMQSWTRVIRMKLNTANSSICLGRTPKKRIGGQYCESPKSLCRLEEKKVLPDVGDWRKWGPTDEKKNQTSYEKKKSDKEGNQRGQA